jgi:hypothetical protein
MRRLGLALLLAASGCLDFAKDRALCDDAGPCRPASDGGGGGGTGGGGGGGGTITPLTPAGPCLADGGYCWEFPATTGQDLSAVWMKGNDVWAVGSGGTVLHYDGARWDVRLGLNPIQPAEDHNYPWLQTVAGSDQGVLVAGDRGYLATLWPDGGLLERRFGCNVYTCGISSLSQRGVRFWLADHEGVALTDLSGPISRLSTSSPQFAIAAVSDEEAWSVGTPPNVARQVFSDGGTNVINLTVQSAQQANMWPISLGLDGVFWIAGDSELALWRVFPDGGMDTTVGTPVHPQSIAATPSGTRYLAMLYTNDAYGPSSLQTCTSGGACTPSPEVTCSGFRAVATDGETAVAVGNGGVIWRKPSLGAPWQPLVPCYRNLARLVPLRDGGVIATGWHRQLIERTATGWEVRSRMVAAPPERAVFSDAWEAPDAGLWVASEVSPRLFRVNLAAPVVPSSQALQEEDGGFLQLGSEPSMRAVRGSPSGEVAWAAGEDGALFRQSSATAWRRVPTQTIRSLNRIWVSDTGTALVVGDGNTILRVEGTSVTTIAGPPVDPQTAWRDVWALSPERFWVVGSSVHHPWKYENGNWSEVALNPDNAPYSIDLECTAITGSPAGDLWVGQLQGSLLHVLPDGTTSWHATGLSARGDPPQIRSLLIRGDRLFIGASDYSLPTVPVITSIPLP